MCGLWGGVLVSHGGRCTSGLFFLSTNLKLGGEMNISGIDCLLLIQILAYFDFTYLLVRPVFLLSDVILLLLSV